MLIEDWPLERIRPYTNNPRVLRNAAQLVADSIREFGWRQAIVVDEDGVIIMGHSRLAAAKLLKLRTAPVHVAKGLSPEQVRALRLADNKTAEAAGWDDHKLADELQAIMAAAGSIQMTGFSQAEFDALTMQAQAELAAILGQPAAPGPAARPDPEAGEPQELDAGTAPAGGQEAHAGDDQGREDPAPADPVPQAPVAELAPFSVQLPVDTRAVLFEAVARAKEKHGLATTAEALLVIARSYLQ